MRLCTSVVVLISAFGATATQAAHLPDTGQDFCYDGAGGLATCTAANTGDSFSSYPRQDGRFGRDAKATEGTLPKVGGGVAGLDYTKVANNGADLPAEAALGGSPTDWACTRDNITSLTWEVKTTNSGLRDWRWTYRWYNTDGATNGGYPGEPAAFANCNSTLPNCNSEAFVSAVNSAALCSYSDWRMPSYRELVTLINYGSSTPTIDTNYFPNTETASGATSCYLSATTDPGEYFSAGNALPRGIFAKAVCFLEGVSSTARPKHPFPISAGALFFPGTVRLVRGTPF